MFPILVVEDDPIVRLEIRSILAQAGLDPVLCRTPPAQEALLAEVSQGLRVTQPVAAVVDLGLPEPEQGLAVLGLLRDEADEIPIALLTGSSSPDARQAARLHDAALVPKGPRMAEDLATALEGCWRGVRDLDGQIQCWLHTLKEACVLWEGLRGQRRTEIAGLLQDEKWSLTREQREALSPLEEALSGADWPPSAGTLATLRLRLLNFVDRLPGEQSRLAHLLSHKVANNFLLGAEFVQGVLHDLRYPRRLLHAATGETLPRELRRDRRHLLIDVVRALEETEERPQPERVLRVQKTFAETRLPSPRSLPRVGAPAPFRRILLVENDETMYRLLEWTLQTLMPGIPVQGCNCASRARERIDEETDPGDLLVVLDLSIPRGPCTTEEHFDFGLEVLSSARSRGVPVIVASGISELPEAIRRALGQAPLSFLPKTSPVELRSRLREQLARLPGAPVSQDEPLYVLRNRGRQVQFRSEIIEVGEPAVSLLRVLASQRTASLLLDAIPDQGEIAQHFWQKGGHGTGRSKNYAKSIRDAVRKANTAIARSLQPRGLTARPVLAIEKNVVRALVPLEVVPPESEALPGFAAGLLSEELEPETRASCPPRPLQVLVVEPLEPYGRCVASWIDESFPSWRTEHPAARCVGTLEEARQALADDPSDIVVLELLTRQSSRPSYKVEGGDAQEALEWLRSVAGTAASPDFVILTGSSDSIHQLEALAACPDLRHYLRKGDDVQTRADLCLALEDLFHRRFGFPVERPRGTPPLFRVQLTAQGTLLLDGVEIQFDLRPPLTPQRWAAPIVLELLASRPGLPLGSERLLHEIRERAEAEIALASRELPEEEARRTHPLYGGGRPRRRGVADEDPDELAENFLSRVVEECRTAILLSLAAKGRHIGFKESISVVGQRTYVLNGARLEGPLVRPR